MNDEGVRIIGLLPVVEKGARILILGSIPGEASLRAQQYYGFPRNHFWRLLYALLDGGEPDEAYEDRTRFAVSNGVALWDVLGACEREGSLDSAIRRPEVNDFGEFFKRYPSIRYVFFNGKTAAALFSKYSAPLLPEDGRSFIVLPSSSPARAMTFDAKLEAWRPVREAWLSGCFE